MKICDVLGEKHNTKVKKRPRKKYQQKVIDDQLSGRLLESIFYIL